MDAIGLFLRLGINIHPLPFACFLHLLSSTKHHLVNWRINGMSNLDADIHNTKLNIRLQDMPNSVVDPFRIDIMLY